MQKGEVIRKPENQASVGSDVRPSPYPVGSGVTLSKGTYRPWLSSPSTLQETNNV